MAGRQVSVQAYLSAPSIITDSKGPTFSTTFGGSRTSRAHRCPGPHARSRGLWWMAGHLRLPTRPHPCENVRRTPFISQSAAFILPFVCQSGFYIHQSSLSLSLSLGTFFVKNILLLYHRFFFFPKQVSKETFINKINYHLHNLLDCSSIYHMNPYLGSYWVQIICM